MYVYVSTAVSIRPKKAARPVYDDYRDIDILQLRLQTNYRAKRKTIVYGK